MVDYTYGNKFTLNGKDYYGFYFIHSNGKYYSGKKYKFGISKILKKIEDNLYGDDKLYYDSLGSKFSYEKRIYPKYYYPILSDKDYEKKYFIRYFVYSLLKNIFIEVNKNNFENLKNNKLYNRVKIN